MSVYVRLALYGNPNLFRNGTLEFVAAPALAPAEVAVDAGLMAVYEAELLHVRILVSQDTGSFYLPLLPRLKEFLFPMTMMIFKVFLLTSFYHSLPMNTIYMQHHQTEHIYPIHSPLSPSLLFSLVYSKLWILPNSIPCCRLILA
jgi:hypothetical protein